MIVLSDVQVFLEIVQSGGLTAAGHRLKLPKSTVARQLRRLETELGCRLIERTTRRLTLTEQGRTFLPYAKRLLEDSDEAVTVLHAGSKDAKGLLSISAPYTFGRSFVAPEIARFRERFPKVRVLLDLTSRRVDLAAEEVDIAVRIGPLEVIDGLARKIGEIRFVLVASPGYLENTPALKAPRDLDAHEFIEVRPPSSPVSRIRLVRDDETVSIGFSPAIRSNDPDCLRIACLGGAGIAALPLFLIQDDLDRGTLERVLPDWAPAPAPVHLLHLARGPQPARIRAFLDFFLEAVASSPRWNCIR